MAGPCLELRDVAMRYGEGPSAVTALESIGLCVEEHEFVSIVGPSGCGKSTLLYLVGGFLRPTAGEIRLRDQTVAGPGRDRGIVFQRYSLFPWLTVSGNIAYGLQEMGLPRAEASASWRGTFGSCTWRAQRSLPRELSAHATARRHASPRRNPDILLRTSRSVRRPQTRDLQDEVSDSAAQEQDVPVRDARRREAVGSVPASSPERGPGRIKNADARFRSATGRVEANPAFAALKLPSGAASEKRGARQWRLTVVIPRKRDPVSFVANTLGPPSRDDDRDDSRWREHGEVTNDAVLEPGVIRLLPC